MCYLKSWKRLRNVAETEYIKMPRFSLLCPVAAIWLQFLVLLSMPSFIVWYTMPLMLIVVFQLLFFSKTWKNCGCSRPLLIISTLVFITLVLAVLKPLLNATVWVPFS